MECLENMRFMLVCVNEYKPSLGKSPCLNHDWHDGRELLDNDWGNKWFVKGIQWCPAGVHGNNVMYSRDVYCSEGMKCRPQNPATSARCWSVYRERQAAYASTFICRQRDNSRLQRNEYCSLALFFYTSLFSLSSRRRLYEENSILRHSPIKQSPRHDDRKVCTSPSFILAMFS